MPEMATMRDLLALLPQAQGVGDSSVMVSRIHNDSRSVQQGDLFVALRGPNFDGAVFLSDARARGAVAAMCDDARAAELLQSAGLSGLVVSDCRRALVELATRWRGRFALPVIAVTGSNGKTTVTQMLASIARAAEPEGWLATAGNFNNDIGVPLSVLRLRPQHRLAVFELGMNHVGEIATLASVAQPTVALINNAQREHLEFMGSVRQVAQENGQVITALPTDGVAVWPAQDAHASVWAALAGTRRASRFAVGRPESVEADVVLVPNDSRDNDMQGQCRATLHSTQGVLELTLGVSGQHNLHNAAAAAACALAAGVSLPAVQRGLQNFMPVAGRSQVLRRAVQGRALTLVDDSYNANPDSVRAAIGLLATLPAPRMLVLGDMGEVGDQGPQFHAEVLQAAVDTGIEHILVTGVAFNQVASKFVVVQAYATGDTLQLDVLGRLPDISSVLIKGSRFMRMERVVQVVLANSTPMEETRPCC